MEKNMRTLQILITAALAIGIATNPIDAPAAQKRSTAASETAAEQPIAVFYFQKNAAAVDKRYKSVTKYVTQTIQAQPASRIRLQGFADASERSAADLAARRAQNVAGELQRNGIPASRISVLAPQVQKSKRKKDQIRHQKVNLLLGGPS